MSASSPGFALCWLAWYDAWINRLLNDDPDFKLLLFSQKRAENAREKRFFVKNIKQV